MDYVKKYDEDLNTTLIFVRDSSTALANNLTWFKAGLFSAVSSAFIIDIYKQLQPDPSDQSAALLRAILLTLNHSAIPNATPTVPPIQSHPPSEIVTVNCLLYASLLISLLAAFAAMLGKQWLNRYLRHAGGSMIERCADRQRKFNGLQRWPFHFIIESLPVMLQIALLLLACGLCRYIMTINTPVACTLIALTGLGVLFYIMVVIAGASSYDCPFQTPGSAPLRRLWTKIGPRITPIVLLVTNVLRTLGGAIQRCIYAVLLLIEARRHLLALQERVKLRIIPILERVQLATLHIGFCLPWIGLNICPSFLNPPLPTTQQGPGPPNSPETTPWFAPNKLAMIQKKNADNVQCVSWVLKDITNPESLDAAIQLAGSIRWFEDGTDVKPLYNLIISTFDTCFGSDGMLHQGSKNRAYYSARAILWIHALAVCKSEEFTQVFSFPTRRYRGPLSDPDLNRLFFAFGWANPHILINKLLDLSRYFPQPHLQWTSSVLLHLSWATQIRPNFYLGSFKDTLEKVDASTPLDALFNLLLMCCNLLGSPVGEEALKIQDKSYGISDPRSPSYSYYCSLVIAWSRSSGR